MIVTRRKLKTVAVAALIGSLCAVGLLRENISRAAEAGQPSQARGAKVNRSAKKRLPKWNLTMKTLGGRQLWGDVHFFHDWRIQRNVLTGHYRLIDGGDYRHTYGTIQECRDKLDEIKKERNLPPMTGKAVVFVHGIIRSSKSFQKLRKQLQEEGYQVFGFDYPSTRVEIPESADHLHQALESLEGIEEINLVVHSMGGLVVRSYLAEHKDKRIRRMVMMGVPNLGARMADKVKQVWLFQAIFGPAGQQLITDPESLIAKLPTPEFEFAILSGARGSINGFNMLIPGDDDGTVSVSSTRLPGAADFITVRSMHSFMMDNAQAIEYTKRFLKQGHFRENGQRHPIPKTEPAEAEKPTP